MGKYRHEVLRGAEFLDQVRPGWRQAVDLDRLDLQRCSRCVLGQLAGADAEVEWEVILAQFGIDDGERSDAFDLGFNLWDADMSSDWDDLTEEWREYIRETRVGAVS